MAIYSDSDSNTDEESEEKKIFWKCLKSSFITKRGGESVLSNYSQLLS